MMDEADQIRISYGSLWLGMLQIGRNFFFRIFGILICQKLDTYMTKKIPKNF